MNRVHVANEQHGGANGPNGEPEAQSSTEVRANDHTVGPHGRAVPGRYRRVPDAGRRRRDAQRRVISPGDTFAIAVDGCARLSRKGTLRSADHTGLTSPARPPKTPAFQ